MSNSYYNHSTFPVTGSAATSQSMRAELDLIAAGFDKLPGLTGNANKLVVINSTATGLTTISTSAQLAASIVDETGTGSLVFADTPTLTNPVITGGSYTPTTFVVPAGTGSTTEGVLQWSTSGDLLTIGTGAATKTFVDLDTAQTVTNKTFNLANNTLVATSAQLAAAVTDETGSGSLVFAVSPALTGTPTAPTAVAGTNTTQIATTAHVFAERSNAFTLTNKTISGASNTLTNIGNSSLTNSSVTIGTTNIALGATSLTLGGLTSVAATTFTGALTGNASTATTLATTRTIWGQNFNGSANVTGALTSVTDITASGTLTSAQMNILAQGDLRLEDATGGQYVALQAPATIASSFTLTLPDTAGASGQALITDGLGNLSWSTSASGDVYGPASATDNAVARFDGTTGKIIQNSAMTIGDDGASVLSVNSASDGLRITQAGSGNALVVEDSANPDATPFVINNAGQLLIGNTTTLSASSPLQIISDGSSALGTGVNMYRMSSDTTGSAVNMLKARGDKTTPTIVSSGDPGLVMTGYGYDGTTYRAMAAIQSFVDGTPGAGDMPGRLVFLTTDDGASSPTERMRIGSTGTFGYNVNNDASVGHYSYFAGLSGTNTYAELAASVVQSGTTTSHRVFNTNPSTAAAAFTLGALYHYNAAQGTIGAGSTVTNQYGYRVESSLTGATNNYGFYSNIASGTGRWNFYAAGTADNYFAGAVGIGSTSLTGYTLSVSKNITGSTSGFGIYNDGAIQSDVTSQAAYIRTQASTQVASFTLPNLYHVFLNQGTFGAGSTVTNQYGVAVGSTLIGATNNYGVYSAIPSGTGRWNFYAAGTADNYFAGSLGIGVLPYAGVNLYIAKAVTGGTTAYEQINGGTVSSDVTAYAGMFESYPATQAAAFTLGQLTHFGAGQGTIGAGSTVNNQYGFNAKATLTGATNNFGFYGDIASGSNRFNFYANGTADNYFAGKVGIGAVPIAGSKLSIAGSTTEASSSSVLAYQTIASVSTTSWNAFATFPSTQAAAFTLPILRHYTAGQGTIGAGSTVTSQYGFNVDAGLTGATNNYGFYSAIASGTGRYNFYAAGSAPNYFAGNVSSSGSISAGDGTNSVQLDSIGGIEILRTGGGYIDFKTSNVDYDCRIQQSSNGFTFQTGGTGSAYTSFNIKSNGNQDTFGTGEVFQAIYRNSAGATNNYVGNQTWWAKNASGSYITQARIIVQQNNVTAGAETSIISLQATKGGTSSTYASFSGENDLVALYTNNGTVRFTVSTAGSVNIGTNVAGANETLRVDRNATGGAATRGILLNQSIRSDSTAQYVGVYSYPTTQATAFTLSNLVHYMADPQAFGAGSTVTSQFGYVTEASLTGATNNYGFWSNIASGSGRFNFYAGGSASNYFAGKVDIGALTGPDTTFSVGGVYTTSGGYSFPLRVIGTTPSSATTGAVLVQSQLTTAAAAFTLPFCYYYQASQNSLGAGSALTTQMGYMAENNLTGATNNYAFYSNIAAGTGRYNFYAGGSADNFMQGSLGVGQAAAGWYGLNPKLLVVSNANSATVLGIGNTSTGASATTEIRMIGGTGNSYVNYVLSDAAGSPSSSFDFGSAVLSTRFTFGNTTRFQMLSSGATAIGGAASAQYGLNVSKNITGSTLSIGVMSSGTIQSDVTTSGQYFRSSATTAAASFSTSISHYLAAQGAIGAGSTVVSQFGFIAESTLTGATNNYGLYSDIASGSGRWNFYAGGSASNYFSGSTGFGTTPDTVNKIVVGGTLPSGSAQTGGIRVVGTIPSTTTATYIAYDSVPTTQAAAFTISSFFHYRAYAPTIGAGSAITSQVGFYVDSGLNNATYNYGFSSNIASGSNRWNFYAGGTAANYMAGQLWLGTTSPGAVQFGVWNSITGATSSYGISCNSTVLSDVTSGATYYNTYATTQAAAFTTNITHYSASQGTIGAGSTVGTQYGYIAGASLTGATNNYGFLSSIASGTGRWNFYAAGTASNYFAGNVGIGQGPDTYGKFAVWCNSNRVVYVDSSGYLNSRYDDNGTAAVSLRNLAVTGANQGFAIQAFLGSDASTNRTAGGIYFLSESDYTTAANADSYIAIYTSADGSNSESLRLDSAGNVLLTRPGGGLGYRTGTGGAVTQGTSRTTGVTLNKTNGAITLFSAAGSATYQTFTVTNSTVAATDVIHVCQKSGTDKYIILVTNVAAGSFAITFATTGGTTTEQPVFNFAVIKAVTA